MIGNRLVACALLGLSLVLGGCNLQALLIRGTVDSTAEFSEEKATQLADPTMVGPVIAAGTVTNEGLLYFVDDYEPLLLGTIFSNVAYGVGWLLAESHQAEIEGNFDKAEEINGRAGLLFARALYYTKRMLRLRDPGFDAAVASGTADFSRWVDENFYEEEDANALLTAGMAYLVAMIESEEGLAAAVDLPYARYMIERSIELDPELNGGQGLMMIGVMECTMPAMLGGRPKVGLAMMEKAAKMENRGNHGILVAMAERCAVALQDRKMFKSLLMEVIEAGDVEEYRLPNKLARHQAERLLKQIDEFFYD
ncbi:MAG: TRAP transporter TatT component family protein [Myxococcales bacterium]|nr:TRAP transporter TatT component family protein [Myxococcales bacterium]